jgi:Arm DNA-binding domain
VIRRRDGYWQVKVYAGRDLLTGKERYEYDRARTKREAERVEAALKTKVAATAAPRRGPWPIWWSAGTSGARA